MSSPRPPSKPAAKAIRKQLWPVGLDWLLRNRGLFDDLELLGLLVLLKIFTEPCRRQFGRSGIEIFLQALLLGHQCFETGRRCSIDSPVPAAEAAFSIASI